MDKQLVLAFSLGIIVFLAGCVKEKVEELQFKNDIITIENYFVSDVAPYEKGEADIQFELHNNGDQKIPYLEVDFFDIPGFQIVSNSLKCEPIGQIDPTGRKCVFSDSNALEPLDVRSITIQLNSTENINSPTPHTVSFAVRYTYFGSREVSIPVIDGQTRKQPLTKFRQSDPSIGPIALDVDPSIEREIIAGDKTIKENWAIGGNNPLPFLTKFKFRHTGNLPDKVKDVNILKGDISLNLRGLKIESTCDFNKIEIPLKSGLKEIVYNGPTQDIKEATKSIESTLEVVSYYDQSTKTWLSYTTDTNVDTLLWLLNIYYSDKSVLVPFDTLICAFKAKEPESLQPEYSATISAFFTYKYEFVKTQDFVVQPLPE